MQTPEHRLYNAAEDGKVDDVKEIIRQHPNININWCNDKGWTALHNASLKGHVDVCKVLIEHKHIRVNAVDNNGYTPLDRAILNNRDEVKELLLKNGAIANKYYKDEDGYWIRK